MKKLLAIALSLIMTLSLTACGEKSESKKPESTTTAATTTQKEADTEAPSDTEAPVTEAPEETTAEATPGEIADFDIGISAIPAEWQKAIGNSMYGMNTGAEDDYSDSYINKFGGVSADDYTKLIAYFDTLSYLEKLDGVYNCEWGQLQIGHNVDASEMSITWYAF